MTIDFRPYCEGIADYELSAEIEKIILPERTHNSVDWLLFDQQRPPHVRYKRWIIELDGQTIGHCAYEQAIDGHHPQKFKLRGSLLPAYQGQGYGKRILSHLETELAPFNPIYLETSTTEQQSRAIHFLEAHGFSERLRGSLSFLDLSTFNVADWNHYIERMEVQGIKIIDMQEVENLLPDGLRQIYDLTYELEHDIPGSRRSDPLDYDTWRDLIFNDPRMIREANFFALDGDRLVGYSGIWKDMNINQFRVGLTGVQRNYRRRGIALALKLHTIQFAQAYGATKVRTWSAGINRPMLNINERLGFQKAPAWITYEKSLT